MKNSEAKGVNVVDKEQVVGIEEHMKDGWESDEMEEEDTMDGKKGHTEESADNDEKAGDTEDNSNTTSITQEEKTEKMEKKSRYQVDRRIQRNKIRMRSWSRQKKRRRKTLRKRRRMMIRRRRPQRIAI